jgi:PadR family transcriptional regulator
MLVYRISPSVFDIQVASGKKTAKQDTSATRESLAERSLAAGQRSLFTGLIRLHVLHHAVEEPVYGFAMIEELRRHGYELSSGTLYPILHGLEKRGLLASARQRHGGTERRVYRATPAGKKALTAAKSKVRELFGELFEKEGEA